MKLKCSGLISVFLIFLSQNLSAQKSEHDVVSGSLRALTEVMIHDITSPPVASRNYVYSLIAFYEAVRPGYAKAGYKSYAGQVNGLKPLPPTIPGTEYDWLTAGTTAFSRTAQHFVFSKNLFQKYWDTVALQIPKHKSPDTHKRSVEFGEEIARHIIEWSREDGYITTRGLARFTAARDPGKWQQTSPDYMEAVEPYWNQIRPMVLSKADQFLITPPCDFSSEKFKKDCREVFETVNTLTTEQRNIANFWDCNPFATQTIGHLMFSGKKISPAGHWVGITGVATRLKDRNLIASLHDHSLVAVAVFDGIIACWDEKYRSNYIRPVTAIQQMFSPTWEPVLQTPPFPEYPSGHSVISNAAATILTALYGEEFPYTDDVEIPYGLPSRSYRSFLEPADEAALSRLYGGIHFREAIENGKVMGKNVGQLVLEKILLPR